MPSPIKPAPDIRGRVLHATLAQVKQRRTHHRRVFSACAVTLAFLPAVYLFWLSLPPTPHTIDPNRVTNPTPPAHGITTSPLAIERIPSTIPLRLTERIPAHSVSAIERVPAQSKSLSTILRISDDQLLSSVPSTQPVALIQNPDGTSRFIVLGAPTAADSL